MYILSRTDRHTISLPCLSLSDLEKLAILQNPSSVKLANPGTLQLTLHTGLFSFASMTFMLSMFNVAVHDIHTVWELPRAAMSTNGVPKG